MKHLFRIALLGVLLLPLGVDAASDKQAAKSAIEKIKQERIHLARLRKQLEQQLGGLGEQLRGLDTALIAARKASREVRMQIEASDKRLASLQHRQKQLQQQVASLQQQIWEEAVAAWQRSSRSSAWLGIFTGVSVSDIPHRRYLLNRLVQSQAKDRQAFIDSARELVKVEADMQAQRDRLALLMQEKTAAEKELEKQTDAKRQMISKVRRDVGLKKKRDEQLAREEKALLKLLESVEESLLAEDQPSAGQSVRKRKGKLSWPLKGRIIASFGARPAPSLPRLKGVQLRPGEGGQVRAMAAGQVRYADWFGGYGLMTIVDYGDGILGVYAHNDELYKQIGDWVEEGELLADAGSTGWVNGTTLYFEIRDGGKAVNPKRWCRR